MSLNETKALCDLVRETGFAIHRYFRQGFAEKVYENSLDRRLRKQGIFVEQQYPLAVHDEDGTVVGEFQADLFVDKKLIVEIKACKELNNDHVAQLLGYLKACRVEDGLLINFGASKFQIRKFILSEELPES